MKQSETVGSRYIRAGAAGRTFLRRAGRTLVAAIVYFLPVMTWAAIFPVNTSPSRFTIYRDPNSGQEIEIGGFSGLFPVPGDASGRLFYTVTDRGPSGDHPNGDDKVFPRPDYAPSILTLRLNGQVSVPGIGGNVTILGVTPLRKPDGSTVSGLPNPCLPDSENGFDVFLNPIEGDSDGLDAEGLSIDAAGNFWVSEEYRPSVAMVDSSGVVRLRLVPAGSLCGDEVIPTRDVLPGILAKRRPNRGLEGVAAWGGRVYAIMQRPLMNPNRATSNGSRHIRIVEIDVAAVQAGASSGVTRQYLYVTEETANQAGTYASDLFPLGDHIFLVSERATDKLFAIDLSQATDISDLEGADGKLFVPVGDHDTIELLTPDELAVAGIQPVGKLEVLPSLTALDPSLEKSEGLAVSNGHIVLCPDNDFNLDGAVDDSTSPVTILFQEPTNREKLVVVPFPAF